MVETAMNQFPCSLNLPLPILALMKRTSLSFVMMCCLLMMGGCASYSNLAQYKQELIRYHDSGKYEAEIERIDEQALQYIRRRAASGETNLAIVLDIDETATSSWDRLLALDFGKDKGLFIQWVNEANAKAIAPTLRLYHETKRLGLKVFFLTGRREQLAAATERNLEKIGYRKADGVYFR